MDLRNLGTIGTYYPAVSYLSLACTHLVLDFSRKTFVERYKGRAFPTFALSTSGWPETWPNDFHNQGSLQILVQGDHLTIY